MDFLNFSILVSPASWGLFFIGNNCLNTNHMVKKQNKRECNSPEQIIQEDYLWVPRLFMRLLWVLNNILVLPKKKINSFLHSYFQDITGTAGTQCFWLHQERGFVCKTDSSSIAKMIPPPILAYWSEKTKHFVFLPVHLHGHSVLLLEPSNCFGLWSIASLSFIFPSGSERGWQKHLLELRYTATTQLIREPCSTLAVQEQGDGLFCLHDL